MDLLLIPSIQCEAEVQAVMRKHAPEIERLKQQLEEHVTTLTSLKRDMEAWMHTIATTRLEAFKTIDVMLALVHQHIPFDKAALIDNDVDGNTLAMTSDELTVQQMGIAAIGDCTRVLRLIKSVAESRGLPEVVDVTSSGQAEQPWTWSIDQFHAWASAGVLKDIADLLKQHKFAGDIIEHMDISSCKGLLSLPAKQGMGFSKEMRALKEKCTSQRMFYEDQLLMFLQ